MTIAPTARIDPRASIGPGVSIGEYCVIEPDVAIGAGCRLEPYVYVKRWTTLGARNQISAGTVLGTDPLDKNFTSERSYLKIGDDTVIASCALVAGYVEVEDQAFISGGVAIHQYSKIGRLAMIGGNGSVNKDVPPFFLYSGFNVEAKGVNLVGLKRAGLSAQQIVALKKAYRLLYRSGLKLEEALCSME